MQNQGQTKLKPKEPRSGVTEVQTHGVEPQTKENKCSDVVKLKVNVCKTSENTKS